MNTRKLLATLLIAAMLLTPMAIMEKLPPSELPEALEEMAEVPVESTEAADETEIAEAVDEAVEEEAEADLGDAPSYEAQWEEADAVDLVEDSEADAVDLVEDSEADAVDLVEDSEADAAEKLMAPAGELAIDAAHFPDAAFRAYIASAFDQDKSGGLSDDERARVSNISLSSYNMVNQEKEHTLQNFSFSIKVDARSLQGIGSFPNLLSLECPGVSIGSLDLSGNPKLQFVNCLNCGLTSLVLGKQSSLKSLNCSYNQIASLDISGCAVLAARVNPAAYHTRYGYVSYYGDAFELSCDITTAITGGVPVAGYSVTSRKSTIYTTAGTVLDIALPNTSAWVAKSSKPKVVKRTKINGDYYWTAKKQGTAKLTFPAKKKKYIVTVKVVDPTIPTSIGLNLSGTVTAKVGETQTLTYTLPAGATSGVKWKSSNKKVATVKNGAVTFKKKGKVTITATTTRGKRKAKVKFIVSK